MSIQKRQGKTGARWVVVIDGERDPVTNKRKQIKRTFKTKDEAQKWERQALVEMDRGTFVEPEKTTVTEYMKYWLENYAKHNVRPTTYRSYEQLIRVRIIPALGAVPLQKLTAARLQSFYGEKLSGGRCDGKEGGLSPRTVRYLHAIIRESLQQATKLQLVARNVADATDPPRASRPQVKTWNRDSVVRFLDAVKDDSYGPIWLLAVTTGMRRGELLALRWQDVDLDRNVLHVRRNLVEIGSALMFQEPKTASGRRAISLSAESVKALKKHHEHVKDRRVRLAHAWNDNHLVFCTVDGKPIAPRNLIRRFKDLCSEAQVPIINFHALRHTHATLLLKEGISAKVASERLGHASIAITLDTYSHVLPDMQQQAAEAVDRALFG